MTKQDAISLFHSIYPDFFEKQYIRNLPDDCICDEMLLCLKEFDPHSYTKELDGDVTFGEYHGNMETIQEAVRKVEPNWAYYYNGEQRIYCGYVNGEIASFCLISDFGEHTINSRKLKIGGPGCVGTIPEYRNRGIGLTMVKKITQLLQEEGYDYGYIHYTGVAPWYAKLGYLTALQWNKHGVL